MNLNQTQVQNALNQAKELGVDVKNIIPASQTDASKLIDTLYQRVVEQEIFENEYSYSLTKLFPMKLVINGIKEFMYQEFSSVATISAYGDADLSDFTGDDLAMLAEIAVVDTEYGKKIEIPNAMFFDMFVQANGVSKFIALLRQQVAFAMEQAFENRLWAKVVEASDEEKITLGTGVKVDSFEGIKEIKKTIVSTIKSLKTTSNKHKYVGTNGVIEIEYKDASGAVSKKSVQPVKKFNVGDFYLVKDINLDLNERFNGSNYEIEYDGQAYEVAGIESIDFSIYNGLEEIKDADGNKVFDAVALPTGFQAMLVHKDALHSLEFYNTSTLIPKTNKPKQILTIFEYMTIYRRKDVPMVLFTVEETAPAK